MLIPSHRHTKADLELWKELEECGLIYSNSHNFAYIENKLVLAITEFINAHKHFYVGVSWGKDSVVLAHLFWQCGCKNNFFYYKEIGREAESINLVRDNFINRFDINYIEVNSGSMTTAEDELKVFFKVMNKVQLEHGKRVLGIRNEESGRRKTRFQMLGFESKNTYAPLSLVKQEFIFAYLHKYDLPINSAYAMLGGGRYDIKQIRTDSLFGEMGNSFGRTEWEREYYPDIYNRIQTKEN